MKRYKLLLYFLMLPLFLQAQTTENVVVVTFDGLRWQEVFSGADKKLLRSKKYSRDPEALQAQYWHPDPQERRKLLLPFFWSKLATEGQLIGNRHKGSTMKLTTRTWKSYAGYNELLSGRQDPDINNNDKIYNRNVTVLEQINRQPAFRGKVTVFGSWDVFPYILNTRRSRLLVNAGNMPATGNSLTPKEQELNKILRSTTPRWDAVRRDTLTYQFAMEYLKKERPRVLYLAFGETDEHAHEGNYTDYLHAARQTDAMIQELWEWLQADEQYRGKTTLIIATDHGRGHLSKKSWRKHGRPRYSGSNYVWMAALGPGIAPTGESDEKKIHYQYQVAELIARLLGVPFAPAREQAPVLPANVSVTN